MRVELNAGKPARQRSLDVLIGEAVVDGQGITLDCQFAGHESPPASTFKISVGNEFMRIYGYPPNCYHLPGNSRGLLKVHVPLRINIIKNRCSR